MTYTILRVCTLGGPLVMLCCVVIVMAFVVLSQQASLRNWLWAKFKEAHGPVDVCTTPRALSCRIGNPSRVWVRAIDHAASRGTWKVPSARRTFLALLLERSVCPSPLGARSYTEALLGHTTTSGSVLHFLRDVVRSVSRDEARGCTPLLLNLPLSSLTALSRACSCPSTFCSSVFRALASRKTTWAQYPPAAFTRRSSSEPHNVCSLPLPL